MKIIKKILFFLLISLLICACDTDFSGEGGTSSVKSSSPKVKTAGWTVFIYMAADNNLESDAITDFNEMERSSLPEDVNVLVLFDRSDSYESSNGDWSDTRLFKVTHDDEINKTLIVSEELDCEELGLKAGEATELNMANPETLSGFLEFGRRSYPADNYALIIWGHGTGWRGDSSVGSDSASGGIEPFRAVAIDNDSSSYMTISQLASAIKEGTGGEKLALLGFDTCFGMCVEAAYELSGTADFMLGTPSLVPGSGWDYTSVFDGFYESDRSTESFIEAISSCYAESYADYSYGAFSCVDLNKIPDLVEKFSSFAGDVACSIETKEERDKIYKIFSSECVSYFANSYPTDFYVDLSDALSCLDSAGIDGAVEIKALVDGALARSWSACGKNASLAVFFCVETAQGVPQGSHPSMYVSDSRDTDVSRFVKDCSGYVPTTERTGSLLDRLFYTFF